MKKKTLRAFPFFRLEKIKGEAKQVCETSLSFGCNNVKNDRNSARLPQFPDSATSKTKQCCDPSFENEKWSAKVTASWQCVLRSCHPLCPPTFRPCGGTKHSETLSVSRLFYLFAGFYLFSSDSFSSDAFSSLTALTTAVASVHKSEV